MVGNLLQLEKQAKNAFEKLEEERIKFWHAKFQEPQADAKKKKNGFKEAVLYVGQEVWARDTDLKLIDR